MLHSNEQSRKSQQYLAPFAIFPSLMAPNCGHSEGRPGEAEARVVLAANDFLPILSACNRPSGP
jgi:hypothetical protein